ncbi:hypothetical protein BLA60_03930 [Actinophytocola xinjiangensis]|uniref:Outer membrane channel protein CpnT-like N-terminal domain-containing protein n=1 Tax=Actinophytocola xinjiangensis TaxID=485602 RepID=A0A7Z0WT04_9PSEU|nr:hypothetical protein [Actinophytocola xinjiangensis]OLF14294.1 hypothetical protein BLA60_03930 [Actinophytocola xinjiangensis]
MTTGLMLPPELGGLLNTLGFSWPQGDEGKIFDLAGEWIAFGGQLSSSVDDAHSQANAVWTNNMAEAVDRFREYWNGPDAPRSNLADGATAATMVGAGLYVCAGVLLALKVAVIAQLVALAIQIAQAIATAAVTFGASLAQIPIFRQITKTLLDMALDVAINALLNV